jgi:hypothetical protein
MKLKEMKVYRSISLTMGIMQYIQLEMEMSGKTFSQVVEMLLAIGMNVRKTQRLKEDQEDLETAKKELEMLQKAKIAKDDPKPFIKTEG